MNPTHAMTWFARQLAPWLSWIAGKEYRRRLERERRQREIMAEYEATDRELAEARKSHRPSAHIIKRKVMLKVKMMQEGV